MVDNHYQTNLNKPLEIKILGLNRCLMISLARNIEETSVSNTGIKVAISREEVNKLHQSKCSSGNYFIDHKM